MKILTIQQLFESGIISIRLKRVLGLLGCTTSKDIIDLSKDKIKVDYIEKSHKLEKELNKAVSDIQELGDALQKYNKAVKNINKPQQQQDIPKPKKQFTVCDYTAELLSKSEKPISQEELLKFIKVHLPNTYIESIRANLYGDHLKRFVFFLDGYIGLKGKTYDKRYQILSIENKKIQYAEQRIMEFLSFIEEKHRSPQPHGLESEESLYRWYSDFIKSSSKEMAELRATFREYLKEYDEWMFTPSEYTYKRNCDQVKWYVDTNLELPSSDDEPELASWFNSQLDHYSKYKDKRSKMFIDLMDYLSDYGLKFYDARTEKGKAVLKENSKKEANNQTKCSILEKYIHLFSSEKEYAIQKALLIIAIGNLIQDKRQNSNEIILNDDLLTEFADVCIDYVGTASSYNIAIPFFYMGYEQFWKLIPREPYCFDNIEDIIDELTYDNIEKKIAYSIIDNDLFDLLSNKKDFDSFKRELIDKLINKEGVIDEDKVDVQLNEKNEPNEAVVVPLVMHENVVDYRTEVNSIYSQASESQNDDHISSCNSGDSLQSDNVTLLNSGRGCCITNANNDIVYSSSGKIVKVSGFILRVNYAWSGVKITKIEKVNNGDYLAGKRISSAKYITPFFKALDPESYIEQIEEIRPSKNNPEDFEIKVSGVWFDHAGNKIEALNNQSFALYCERIANIKQAKIHGEVILAKPVLLLSMIDGVNEEVFSNNRFVLNGWLEKHYESLMGKYTKNSIFHKITPINNPFWHLQSDGFWHLHYNGAQPTVINTPTMQWLEKNVNYASFDEDLWVLLQDREMRNKLRAFIIENKLTDKVEVSETKPASYNDVSSNVKESTIEVSSYNEAKDKQKEELSTFQDEQHYKIGGYEIVNQDYKCKILDSEGKVLFASGGKLTYIEGVFFRVSYTHSSISINIIDRDRHDAFLLGTKILKASYHSPLFKSLNPQEYIGQFQDVRFDCFKKVYYFKVDNKWYDNSGYRAAFDKFEKVNTTRVDNKVKPLSSGHGQGLEIIDFGMQSIAVIGDTKPHKNALKAMGGFYISRTVFGPVWTFNKKQRERIQAFIDGNASPVDHREENVQEERPNIQSKYVIRVKYPNGRESCSNLVWQTLVDVVIYAGAFRVRQLNINHLGDNLVSNKPASNPAYRGGQKDVGGGLYVSTSSSTDTKYKQISRINEELKLNLIIEKVYISDKGSAQTYDIKVSKNSAKSANENKTNADYRIGYKVRLLPSQIVGVIVDTTINAKGVKKIIVKTNRGKLIEEDDIPYFYEILKRN